MQELSFEGRNLLRFIVEQLKEVNIRDNRTYPTYSQAHEALKLPLVGPNVGFSLQAQGLTDLARFAVDNGLPAITGLIVRKQDHQPGKGFFDLYGKDELADQGWWLEQTSEVANTDWKPYL